MGIIKNKLQTTNTKKYATRIIQSQLFRRTNF